MFELLYKEISESILVDGKMVALNTPANLKKEYSASSMNEVFISLARQGQRVE